MSDRITNPLNSKFIDNLNSPKTGVYVGKYGGLPAIVFRLYTDANNWTNLMLWENGKISRVTCVNGVNSGWEIIHDEWKP